MGRILYFGEFRMDRDAGVLLRNDEPVRLRRKLWDVLSLLIDRRGSLVSPDEILEVVWQGVPVGEKSVGNRLYELRKALGDASAEPRYIVTIPARGFRFIAEVRETPAGGDSNDFVGRAEELRQLRLVWNRALAGESQLITIAGEAGVGKTSLVKQFLREISGTQAAPMIFIGRCAAREGEAAAYLPVFDILDSWNQAEGNDGVSIVDLLRRHAPHWSRQVAWADGSRSSSALGVVDARPDRMLREMAALTEAASALRPLVLVFEDLHWADHATLDLITYLARRTVRSRLILVTTYRHAEAVAAAHPAIRMRLAPWESSTFLDLQPLSREEVQECLSRVFAGEFDVVARVLDEIMRQTAGVPLFVLALAQLLIDKKLVSRTADGWRVAADANLSAIGVMSQVTDLLEEQMRGLSAEERTILEVGAVVGEAADAAAIAGGLDLDVEVVDDELRRQATRSALVTEVGVSMWPDGTTAGRFRFRHALYREALYRGIPTARRARLHRQVGNAIERGFAAAPHGVITTLAEHFEAGGDHPKAAEYLERTALHLVACSATRDAAGFFKRALDRVQMLPQGPDRWGREVRVRTGYGLAVGMSEGLGAPVIQESYAEVSRLRKHLSDPEALFPTLRVFWVFELLRFGYAEMGELNDQLRTIAHASGNPIYQSLAASMTGTTYCFLGDLRQARRYLEESLTLCDDPALLPPPHAWLADPRVESRCMLAWLFWLMGESSRSRGMLAEAQQLATRSGHDSTRGLVLWFRSSLAQLDSDVEATRAAADELQALAEESDMGAWLQIATLVRALAALVEGDPSALECGLASLMSAEGSPTVVIARAYLLGQLALAYGRRGQGAHGLALIDMALARIAENSARVSEADLLRIRGELLEGSGNFSDASRVYQQAIEVARGQGAHAFELRAATARYRLSLGPAAAVETQADPENARSVLDAVCQTLVDAGDTHDLRVARKLLQHEVAFRS